MSTNLDDIMVYIVVKSIYTIIKIMNDSLLQDLENLNLSLNEAKVYLALIEIGQTSAGALIKKTSLHRSVVYETLDKLIERKLVFKLTKQNIAYFQSADPSRLLDDIHRQEQTALDLVPKLNQMIDTSMPEITVYQGIESYRRFWLDSVKRLKPGSVDYVAGSIGGPWMEFLGQEAVDRYFKTASKRSITWKLIVFDIDDLEQPFLSRYGDFKAECRLIEKRVTKEGNFNVFGTESVILHSATEPMIIEVKNQSLVRVFQNLFDILWELGKPLAIKK